MQNAYYRPGEYIRTAQMIDGVIETLYAHVSGAVGSRVMQEHGLSLLSPPANLGGEICLAAHHKRLITQRSHVWHVLPDSRRILFGRVRLHELDHANELGKPVVSMIVRYDGFVSFDGTIDVQEPVTQPGYEEVVVDRLARVSMAAVYDLLDVVG